MAVSIDTYLRSLSLSYYLKNNSDEVKQIDASLTGLLINLKTGLGVRIKRTFVFGSYDRNTILPRKFDSKSDIDVMVVFNHTEYERTPETYRTWLKTFADKYYKDRFGSGVAKSFPTITIRLGHIYFDLVPAKEEQVWHSPTLSIPGNFGWRETNPNDIKQKLVDANTRYNQVVRPIIRLLKAWNCNNGYPYDSYLLELQITDMNFYGDNVQAGFFYAVNQLDTIYGDPESKAFKIRSLQNNIDEVKKALADDNTVLAKQWLHKILPNP